MYALMTLHCRMLPQTYSLGSCVVTRPVSRRYANGCRHTVMFFSKRAVQCNSCTNTADYYIDITIQSEQSTTFFFLTYF